VVEEISYKAPSFKGTDFIIDRDYVQQRLKN
jgi:ATP-dependent protease HslVU (ClpYQ) ATPase subunit